MSIRVQKGIDNFNIIYVCANYVILFFRAIYLMLIALWHVVDTQFERINNIIIIIIIHINTLFGT